MMMRCIDVSRKVVVLVFAGMVSMFVAGLPATAQQEVQGALRDNCIRIGIDQCYSEAGGRFFETIFLKGVRESGAASSDKALVESISYRFPADRNVLRWRSFVEPNGKPVVEVSSGVLYNLHSLSYAAVLDAALGNTNLESYERYVQALVASQEENLRRAQAGQPTVASPTYAQVNNVDAGRELDLMKADASRAFTILFFQAQVIWILGHETGHHKWKHFRDSADKRSDRELQTMEVEADAFATRTLVRLGYSALPVFYGLTYMAAVERHLAGRISRQTHPNAKCRLASLIEVSKAEYRSVGQTRDGMNSDLNAHFWRPEARSPAVLRGEAGGC